LDSGGFIANLLLFAKVFCLVKDDVTKLILLSGSGNVWIKANCGDNVVDLLMKLTLNSVYNYLGLFSVEAVCFVWLHL